MENITFHLKNSCNCCPSNIPKQDNISFNSFDYEKYLNNNEDIKNKLYSNKNNFNAIQLKYFAWMHWKNYGSKEASRNNINYKIINENSRDNLHENLLICNSKIKHTNYYCNNYFEKFKSLYSNYKYKKIQYNSISDYKNNNVYKKKTGIVCTTHGNMGIYIIQAIRSFLKFMPNNTYIVVYINESNDPEIMNIHHLFPTIDIIYIQNQNIHGGLTGTWNAGIDMCFKKLCDNVILANDDIFILPNIHYILKELDECNDDMKYFGPLTNEPGPDNYMQMSLNPCEKNPFILKQNNKVWNLNGFFLAFPKHVLIANKFNNKYYFDPLYPFEKNEVNWFERFKKINGLPIVVPKTFVYHYKLSSWKTSKINNTCIYTCALGGYEDAIYLHKINNYDMFYFTDCFNSMYECIKRKIKPMLIFELENSILQQRSIKSCPNKYLPGNYNRSIWLDGNLFSLLVNLDSYDIITNDIVCFQHPERKNIEQEIDKLLELNIVNIKSINKMKILYKDNNYLPIEHNQLHETCILVRKHNESINNINEEWEKCINICHRDQLSFDFLLWKHNVKYQSIPIKQRPVLKCSHSEKGEIKIRKSLSVI